MNKKYQELLEFQISEIDPSSPKQLLYSLVAEIVIFTMLKVTVQRLLRRSRVDPDLSREVSTMLPSDIDVRLIRDDRVFSFHDTKNIIWISQGLTSLLDREELIAVLLHEYGHGDDKLKILYEKFIKESPESPYSILPRAPNRPNLLFRILGNLIKRQGINTSALNKTRVYFLSYIIYTSVSKYPLKGTYKWSYSDFAIQKGYWDQYESALYKINRYISRQKRSKLALKLSELGPVDAQSEKQYSDALDKSLKDQSDSMSAVKKSIPNQVKRQLNPALVSKIISSVLR